MKVDADADARHASAGQEGEKTGTGTDTGRTNIQKILGIDEDPADVQVHDPHPDLLSIDPPEPDALRGLDESADPKSKYYAASREVQQSFLELLKKDDIFQTISPQDVLQLRKELSPRLDRMSDAELAALRTYTADGGSYGVLNRALREGDADVMSRYEPYYRTLQSGLNKLRASNAEHGFGWNPSTPVVRKMHVPVEGGGLDQLLGQYQPGTGIEYRGMFSAGIGHSPFDSKPGMNVTMVAYGHSFVDVNAVSYYKGEGEAIGMDGTKFVVEHVDAMDPEDVKIVLREADAPPVYPDGSSPEPSGNSRIESMLEP